MGDFCDDPSRYRKRREGLPTIGMRRRVLGIVLIDAGPAAVAVGYANAPTASSCNSINDSNRALGLGPTCSTAPSAVYFWAGAVLVIAGLLVIVPWWRRLVEDQGGARDREGFDYREGFLHLYDNYSSS
jgi:hypothetical protein